LGWIILGSLVPISYQGRTAAEPEKYKKLGSSGRPKGLFLSGYGSPRAVRARGRQDHPVVQAKVGHGGPAPMRSCATCGIPPNAYTGPTQRHSLTRCSGNGPLRAGLERDSAIDIVWFFYRPRSLSTTRSRQAWSLPRYEEWLVQRSSISFHRPQPRVRPLARAARRPRAAPLRHRLGAGPGEPPTLDVTFEEIAAFCCHRRTRL
jgi:hypothetical protein